MENMEFLSSRLQCSREDKLECFRTVKKLYGLSVLARKEGFLALSDAVVEEDLFLKTMVDTFLEAPEAETLDKILFAYLVVGDYCGKDFLKNLLVVEGLLLIAKQTAPSKVIHGLQGWFGVELAQIYKKEMTAEMARQNPPILMMESAVPEFDRFARFSKVHTIKLLSELESSVLALALKGASDRVKHRFFFLMESSQAEEVRAEIDCLGCIRVMDVEEAQRYILEKAKGSGGKADGDA